MEEMGAFHLAGDTKMYQPVRSNNFRFVVSGLEGLIRAGENVGNQSKYINNAQDVLDFSVISFSPPHFKQEELEIKRGNSKIYFAGTPTWDSKPLKIYDFVGADGKSVLMAWQAKSYNISEDTIPSDAANYKLNAKVFEYTSDHKIIRSWDIIGCWVTGIEEDDWSNDTAEKKTVTATIRYDRAVPHFEYTAN